MTFLIVASLFLLVNTNQKLNTAATTNTVSFSGEGKVVSKADIAAVYLSIVTESATSKSAQDDNSKKSKAVVEFLKKQKIEDKDIKTVSYNIYPQYTYPRYDKPVISGYQVNQTMTIKIRNLDEVSAILDGVVSAGANQINSLSFEIDEPEKLKAEARKMAIADAKKKARELEKELGIDLGKIINFSENTGGFPTPVYLEAKGDMGGGGDSGPSVPSGENEISVNVYLTYQIK
ncbi:MAG: hypothetical protein UU84_C0015G0005 [Candidatus Yanofskybacteria bacterium GW2011_GWC2_41_9]|nr:MAG: hypothetical protein UU84_C0015G0005 [Candidatus Yanofskybacteria bacterium GW2011_GWC2_41_9]OGN19915.1 MAG: hypothetical protein A3B00_00215 [Candidatus Yanofskybacteria bacterium RIFCSPLOWO2_01_FULL_41_33]